MVVVQGNKNTFYSILFNASLNLFAFIHQITTFLLFVIVDKGVFFYVVTLFIILINETKKKRFFLFSLQEQILN